MSKCPYANALGRAGEGVHATRVLDMSLNDWLMTILVAGLMSWLFKLDFVYTLVALFVLGEVLHYIFGVKSAFLKGIGLEPHCDT